MARLVRNSKLDSRTARAKLRSSRAHGDAYWQRVEPGVALGYYKPINAVSGTWLVRRRIGTRMLKEKIALADDYSDADGLKVLDFAQAQRAAIAGERAATLRETEGGFTVGDALDLWLAHYEAGARSPTAIRETRHKVNVIRRELGDRLVIDLKAADIRRWRDRIAKSGRSVRASKGTTRQLVADPDIDPREVKRRRHATANRQLTQLKAALNFAWNEGRASNDTEWRRVKPFKDADQPRTRYLTADEVSRLINACTPTFRPLVRAAVLTGCRWGELREMRVHQFDPAAGTVVVQHAKGGRDRQVPLSEEGTTFFAQRTSGRPRNAMMFERSDGMAWGPQDQKRPMIDASRAAGIVPPVGFHTLRHTYGSLLAMAGVPLPVIAAAMGHSDTRMTERHYAHLAPSYVSETIRRYLPRFSDNAEENISDLGARRAGRVRR
jgi:integrase